MAASDPNIHHYPGVPLPPTALPLPQPPLPDFNIVSPSFTGTSNGFIGAFPPPGLVLDLANLSEEFENFDESNRKEREILSTHRVKLTEYIHDCTILHPYMKDKKVFTKFDCNLIDHEVTEAQKMDKFIDIMLTKGPKAIGIFHEGLKNFYPYVFDVLTRLFTNAGIQLPKTRQIEEEPSEVVDPSCELSDFSLKSDTTTTSFSMRRRKNPTIRQTIRRHINELTERCEAVKHQRDELQEALLQREKDINTLFSHRDQQIQQKYEDMLSLLAHWRDIITHQSDGSIEKMQELVTEHEGITEAYELLDADYMLVECELSAARDRISKLLSHLEKLETECSLTQDKNLELNDKLQVQQGEIQRLERKLQRIGKDPSDKSGSLEKELDISKMHKTKYFEEKIKEYEEKLKVCQLERKQTIVEKDEILSKLHEEKSRRKKAEKQVFKLKNPDAQSIGSPQMYRKCRSEPYDSQIDSTSTTPATLKAVPLLKETVYMPADNPGMEIGLGVVVRSLTESGNAVKNGVQLGDEIYEVNRIGVSSDCDSLIFTQKLISSASQTITLSIKRQAGGGGGGGNQDSLTHNLPLIPKSSIPSSTSATPVKLHDIDSLYSSILHQQKRSSGLPASLQRRPKLLPKTSNISSSTSNSAKSHDTRDTSDDISEEESGESHDENNNYMLSDQEYVPSPRLSELSVGIITSPKGSLGCRDCLYDTISRGGETFSTQGTINGKILPEQGSPSGESYIKILHNDMDGDGYINLLHNSDENMDGSDSTDAPMSLEDLPSQNKKHRSRNAIYRRRKRTFRKKKPSENGVDDQIRLSKSLDDIDMIQSPADLTADEVLRDGSRRVLLPFGQLGIGISIMGGRGSGLYIRSRRDTNRSLRAGDNIIQICGRLTQKMTYAEAVELMSRCNGKGKQCLLQVKYDKEGYQKLGLFARDNFYVRAKVSHKSRYRPELSFESGDVFHVTDTKPLDIRNVWQVEKLNARGQIMETGCIPIILDSAEYITAIGSHSLPRLMMNSRVKMDGHMTFQPKITKRAPAHSAYELYQPIRKLDVTDPRPVILIGVFDTELRDCLINKGSKDNVQFALADREPVEKIAKAHGTAGANLEDKIVETITFSDGPMKSTVEDVMEVARKGNHCVLHLSPSDLLKPVVTSLRPIVIGLIPHNKTIKVKTVAGRLPTGFTQEVLSQVVVSHIKEKIRRIQPFMTGEVEVSSPLNVDDLVTNIRTTIIEQQKHIFWEPDLP